MAQNVSPAELSLSAFLTKLVTDASEAFLVAQQHQESYYSDLQAASTATPAEFAKAIPDAEVDRELASLFPSAESTRPHAIFVGAPYSPPRPAAVEDPPIQQTLGVRLVPDAVPSLAQGLPDTGSVLRAAPPAGPQPPPAAIVHLSQEQVQLIRDAARLQVSARQQGYLKKVLSQPRVGIIMDSARISAKVVLGARADTEPGPTAASPPGSALSTPVQRLVQAPSPLQLSVRMVDDKAPQTSGLSVDIYSEIELKLKSIIS